MKAAHFSAALAVTLLLAGGAYAQDHQFNDHDRQVSQTYYNQHQKNAPAGMRTQDRLTTEQEGRLKSGQPFDHELQTRSHSVPRELGRQLTPAPKHHKYVVIGQHVALVDTTHNIVRDVIRLEDHH